MKTDRKSIVVSGSLDITSGSRLKWPFMPKQGPISMDIHEYPWIFMDIHGYPWITMDIHGYSWISMDIHGYPWISMDIGPCFGMNGHFRPDPDVISRLPDTTIHFLSVFIGFRC